MAIGERIKELRVQKKLTQTDLAKLVKLTYIQIGRYEANKSNPSADVLQRLAHALDTTTDFLMKGTEDEAVAAQLSDKELLKQYKQVEQLNQEDKHLVKTFIDAFLTKRQLQQLAQ
ncbi:MAG TPA: helix-turn-helix transcriptional regulator [Chitinophagaceae bacterium]|nr:helix-turn-helix transcriptional regulator [Chitinophagaceae bacterium]HQV55377.1 helix-turn-helix transcriptional regulator [Chitinophagaceae bacterium]